MRKFLGKGLTRLRAHFIYDNTPLSIAIRLRRLTGIKQGNFFLLFILVVQYFMAEIGSVIMRSLLERLLEESFLGTTNYFFRGRQILISHVLQTMLVYLLTVMNPQKRVIDQIHQLLARFLWKGTGGIKGKHWVAWSNLSYPKEKGELGFRSLIEVNKALMAKLWWTFETATTSLWA